jgi:hypothetical protein
MVLAIAGAGYAVRADDAERANYGASDTPMQFEWHNERPAENCGKHCRQWISAVGSISDQTPRDFQIFAEKHAVRGMPILLDSAGGSVAGAIELGRAIRRLDMKTMAGKTVVVRSGERVVGATMSPDVSCSSMCVFLLLGGTKRHVPHEARIFVHQIWLAKKRKQILNSKYTASEISIVERDIGSLARYTVDMGGHIELLELSLRVPAWEPMHRLSADEIQRVNLSTTNNVFDDNRSPVAANQSAAAEVQVVGRARD